jgi:hypothetical protein
MILMILHFSPLSILPHSMMDAPEDPDAPDDLRIGDLNHPDRTDAPDDLHPDLLGNLYPPVLLGHLSMNHPELLGDLNLNHVYQV